MSITLDDLISAAKATVGRDRRLLPEAELVERLSAREAGSAGRFRDALVAPGIRVIAEVKGASPIAGTLRERLDPAQLAREYEAAGAAALSVLTEEQHFAGSLEHLRQVAAAVALPVLRKDFIVDGYQVRQAALAGAAAVLLITEVLDGSQLRDLVALAHALGLDALVEVHEVAAIEAAHAAGSGLIGVNNRNLETMEVDWRHCLEVADRLPRDAVRVAESGLGDRGQIAAVTAAGYHAVLVGTGLVTAADPGAVLSGWLQESC